MREGACHAWWGHTLVQALALQFAAATDSIKMAQPNQKLFYVA